jgi:hypothetical protein
VLARGITAEPVDWVNVDDVTQLAEEVIQHRRLAIRGRQVLLDPSPKIVD